MRTWLALILASFLSQSGSYFLTLALSAYVFAKTGSPAKAGLVFVLSTLPSVLASGRIGAWLDRNLSKNVLIANELLSAAASLLCGVLLYYELSLVWIGAVIGVRSIFLQVERTSILKWLKEISPAETQSRRFRFFFLAFFLSTLVAGILVAVVIGKGFSPEIVIIDVVSYLAAVAVILGLPAVHLRAGAGDGESPRLLSTIREMFGAPALRPHLLAICFTQSLFQGVSTLLVVFLPLAHFQDRAGVGLFQVAISLGITAGFLVGPLVRFSSAIVTVGIGCLLSAVVVPSLVPVLGLIFLLNFCYEAVWLSSMTAFLSSVAPAVIARYQFVVSSLAGILMSLSMVVYAWLLEVHPLPTATFLHVVICGAVLLVAVAGRWQWSIGLRRLAHYNFGFLRGFWLSKMHGTTGASLIVNPRSRFFLDPGAKLTLKGRFLFGYTPVDANNQLFAHAGQLTMRQNSIFETEGRAEIWPGMKIFIRKNAKIKIGRQTFIAGDGTIIISTSLNIGDECAISWGVQILDTDAHDILDSSGKSLNPDSPITIGNRVWIGQGVKILKGARLGNNVIVGAGSVVTGTFGDNLIIAGNPAKVVRPLEGTWSYVPRGAMPENYCW